MIQPVFDSDKLFRGMCQGLRTRLKIYSFQNSDFKMDQFQNRLFLKMDQSQSRLKIGSILSFWSPDFDIEFWFFGHSHKWYQIVQFISNIIF